MTYPPKPRISAQPQQPTSSSPRPPSNSASPRRRRHRPGADRRRGPEQAAVLPARRRRRARPRRLLVQLRADVHDQQHRLPAAGQRQRQLAGPRPRRRRGASGRAAGRGRACCPSRRPPVGAVAAIAVLAFLLVDRGTDTTSPKASASAGPCTSSSCCRSCRRIVAVAALLLDAGIITAPAPKPKYEPQQYGQYGAPGRLLRPAGASTRRTRAAAAAPAATRRSTGGYPGRSGSSGGFQAVGQQSGPPTPPTGFPTYGQPQVAPARRRRTQRPVTAVGFVAISPATRRRSRRLASVNFARVRAKSCYTASGGQQAGRQLARLATCSGLRSARRWWRWSSSRR